MLDPQTMARILVATAMLQTSILRILQFGESSIVHDASKPFNYLLIYTYETGAFSYGSEACRSTFFFAEGGGGAALAC